MGRYHGAAPAIVCSDRRGAGGRSRGRDGVDFRGPRGLSCRRLSGSRPGDRFASPLFPFLVHAHRGVRRTVPPATRRGVDELTDVVAFSAVQTATGEVADIGSPPPQGPRSADARRRDAGLRMASARRLGFDVLVFASYKWLMSPRGTAFLSCRSGSSRRCRCGQLVRGRGRLLLVLRRAATGRADGGRLDTRRRGTAGWRRAALALLDERVDAVHAHDVGLANRFRAGLGLRRRLRDRLRRRPGSGGETGRAGIRAAMRAAACASFHLYNTGDDVDRALDGLT